MKFTYSIALASTLFAMQNFHRSVQELLSIISVSHSLTTVVGYINSAFHTTGQEFAAVLSTYYDFISMVTLMGVCFKPLPKTGKAHADSHWSAVFTCNERFHNFGGTTKTLWHVAYQDIDLPLQNQLQNIKTHSTSEIIKN